MTPGWAESYLGLIFQFYGLAFFVLGVAALLSMRHDTGQGLIAHLGWLAAFGMLHGLQEFTDGERLHNPAAWLVVLGNALMVVSFAALLEFGRRLWNDRPGGRRLAALPLYAAAGGGILALMLTAPAAGLELGARYLLGAPGAVLAGIGLLVQARAIVHSSDTVVIVRWLRLAAIAMLGYAGLSLFLSAGSGRLLVDWLPTTADFLAATGLPVQLARALCAVLLAVCFLVIAQRSASLIAESLRRVTDRLDGFVYRCRNDRNWSVIFMSGGGETLIGYPIADFLRGARHFADHIHPGDRQRVWDEVQAALVARHDFRLYYRMLDRAGNARWCYEEGRGVFNAQGELLFLEGLVRNDDARYQAEDARRRMQGLVEGSPQAMGWADLDGTVRYFNRALRTLLAVPADVDITGYRLRDFYDDKAYEQIEATVLPAAAAQGAWVGEAEIIALDGRRVPTLHSVFVLRNEVGEVSAFANVITDMTTIRAAERDLRIKDAAIASSTSAIALAGLDGALTYVNQAFVELWGLASPEEALGRSALSFWEQPGQAQAVVDTLAHAGHWQGELRGVRADGALVDVHLAANMVLDHDGKPLCMMGSFLDVTARNQTRQALQRERDFAQGLLDTAPVIILLLDRQGMIRHVNPWFEQSTGYRRDEVVGKEWFATFLPERDRARIRALFASALHDQPVRGNINPIVTRDGEERAIEWHAMTLRDTAGQMTGLLSIGMDVTDRQRIVEEIRVSEARLIEAQRIARVGSWELDLVSSHLFWTDEIFNLFELEKAQFDASYEAFLDVIHPDDRDKVNAAYAQSLADRKPYVITHRLRMADGRIKWVEERCSTDYDADGKPLRSRGTVQDITDRQQLEDKLKKLNQSLEQRVAERTAELSEQSQRNAAILRTAIDGFFAADANGRLRQVNPAFCAMLGYEEAELLEMGIPDIEAVETAEETAAHIRKVAAQGHDRFDTRHRRKDGGTIDVEISVSVLILDGTPMFYAVARDIGPRKAAEAALRLARDEAERANLAKSEFLSRMSHELRTPLNAILGFSQLLEMEVRDAQQAENVQEILKAGHHLLTQVNEVLDLARIDSGRIELSLGPVGVAAAVADCLAQLKPLAEQRGLAMNAAIDGALYVQADLIRFKQVLLNLVSNAIKYNRDGGTIDVTASLEQGRARIAVRDTGRGIAPEKLEQLFKPFERLESSNDGIEGTGIGLTLVKRLAEAMGGEVGVESAAGVGSTFWFVLPAATSPDLPETAPPTVGAGGTAPDRPPPGQIRHRVLCIEDNPANLKLVRKMLAARPEFTLLDAMNAELGLEIARRERPDLILLDINMPGMDGYAVLKTLQADNVLRETPVIAISANAMLGDIERGLAAGFRDYLTKPLDIRHFLKALDRHLPASSGNSKT